MLGNNPLSDSVVVKIWCDYATTNWIKVPYMLKSLFQISHQTRLAWWMCWCIFVRNYLHLFVIHLGFYTQPIRLRCKRYIVIYCHHALCPKEIANHMYDYEMLHNNIIINILQALLISLYIFHEINHLIMNLPRHCPVFHCFVTNIRLVSVKSDWILRWIKRSYKCAESYC